MKKILVAKLKPNPEGKDRMYGQTPAAQLAAEWVQIKNAGDESFTFNSEIRLYHVAYSTGCGNGKWAEVMSLPTFTLAPGESIRIHSGKQIPPTQMHHQDTVGANYRAFTNQSYIWNNSCGDSAGLWGGSKWLDQASYSANPAEGKILTRIGNTLI